MRVRVLCTSLQYGRIEHPFGAELFVRDTEAMQLLANGAVEPSGRPAIQRAAELKLQVDQAEAARLAELHRDRMEAETRNREANEARVRGVALFGPKKTAVR